MITGINAPANITVNPEIENQAATTAIAIDVDNTKCFKDRMCPLNGLRYIRYNFGKHIQRLDRPREYTLS